MSLCQRERDHPRLRGEYDLPPSGDMQRAGSPPLARGILAVNCIDRINYGITPACAGNTIYMRLQSLFLWDHPRLRGEYDVYVMLMQIRMGSPPLARGIRFSTASRHSSTGITPACAGNTSPLLFHAFHRRDHPRLRGEYSVF